MLRLCIAISLSLLVANPVSSETDDRILNGVPTAANELPWVAGIFNYPSGAGSPLFCSGSLISNQWVLTSKYCATGARHFAVYLGAHNLSDFEPNRINVPADDYVLSDNADLALIRLSSPVAYNDYIRPIPLASNDYGEAVGNQVIVSGWGAYTSGSTRPSQVLRKSTAAILTDTPCMQTFGSYSASAICTNGSLCQGDEGSPLTTKLANGTYMLIGVASHGFQSCQSPSGFTAIYPNLNWIKMISGAGPSPSPSSTVRSTTGSTTSSPTSSPTSSTIRSTTNSGPFTTFNPLNLLITIPLLYIFTLIQ